MWRDLRDVLSGLGFAAVCLAAMAVMVGMFYSIIILMIAGVLRLVGAV